ncbi:siderophore biosynthesis protein SbnD, partial [Staphylococcus aureus]
LQGSVYEGSLVGLVMVGITVSILGVSALLMSIVIFTFIVSIYGELKLIETTHIPKPQTLNINKGIIRSLQCLLCTQQTSRCIN